jgi:hypothetical protein
MGPTTNLNIDKARYRKMPGFFYLASADTSGKIYFEAGLARVQTPTR